MAFFKPSRFKIELNACLDSETQSQIVLESNTGFRTTLSCSPAFTVKSLYERITFALNSIYCEPVDDAVIYSSICEEENRTTLEISNEKVIEMLSSLHIEYEIRPLFPALKELWAEKYDEKVEEDIDDHSSTLLVQGSALDLLTELITAFGGIKPEFTAEDAIKILMHSAEKEQFISQDQFCEAMELSVRSKMQPSFLQTLRLSKSISQIGDITLVE